MFSVRRISGHRKGVVATRFGYSRVSTDLQNLELQIDALERFGCDRIYSEHMTGTRFDRPEFQKMCGQLREGDVVVVWKLDRLGRSTKQLIELVEEWEKMGVDFVSLQDSIDTTTAMGRFFFRLMASFAELERDLTAERVRAGLDAARARGRVGGRPKADPAAVDRAIRMHATGEFSIKEICDATGISVGTLYKYLHMGEERMTE